MRIKTLSLLTGAILCGSAVHAQLERIVVQGSGAPQVFTDIYDAVAAAQPNDKLYFSGGIFLADTGLTLSMPLHFIGAGIHPDSTNATTATILTTSGTTDFTFTTGASGSSFTGIRFIPGASSTTARASPMMTQRACCSSGALSNSSASQQPNPALPAAPSTSASSTMVYPVMEVQLRSTVA
ncbi:MAG: hypothetical protein IPJ85_09820 [Flavobacteriales bacterium]|nr:hypothetical protein [Flavobacteriales bacterium]